MAPPCHKDRLEEEGGRTASRWDNEVQFDRLSGDERVSERLTFQLDLEVE